ncbi:succinate-semialdehyde dehydrogenase [Oscillibacter sp. PC13]|uniref:aldehyde dehydrogenase family protein n=1 Tax=Oscillibacter sp. PC13 TaxID=1855299 RepID=UPI0008DF01DF|nr:aldehyde dehydrogenase family protein [Oscillibacter sp. PC13]SFQ15885.1 succinate-semialdehyde dehydrogenase [Oscillibacter sp. PC13]
MSIVSEKLEKARKAMAEIQGYTQEQVDALVYAIGKTIYKNAVPLAEMAVSESKIGSVSEVIAMNEGTAAEFYAYLKDKKSVGIIAEYPELKMMEVAHPVGVVAGITPSTTPVTTACGNAMHAIKGKNAIVFCPAPRAKGVTVKTVELMREAIAACGAPIDLIQIVSEPTIPASQELMEGANLILATGGSSMVRAAYSSGTPAYGVGPGNAPVILDRGYDLQHAADLTNLAVSVDNGVACDSDNILFYPNEVEIDFFKALENAAGIVYTAPEDVKKYREVLFGPNGAQIPSTIGLDAPVLAKLAGFEIPETKKFICLQVADVGKGDMLNHEILAPVVKVKSYDTFESAVEMSIRNMEEQGGIGHSAGIFSNDMDHIKYYSERIPVARVLVNQPTPDAWGPVTNALSPAVMESCGTWGSNIMAGNVDYTHLLNISKVTMPLDAEPIDGAKLFAD